MLGNGWPVLLRMVFRVAAATQQCKKCYRPYLAKTFNNHSLGSPLELSLRSNAQIQLRAILLSYRERLHHTDARRAFNRTTITRSSAATTVRWCGMGRHQRVLGGGRIALRPSSHAGRGPVFRTVMPRLHRYSPLPTPGFGDGPRSSAVRMK